MSESPIIYLVWHHLDWRESRFFPFGIMYVGQALMDAGFRVRLFHLKPTEDNTLLSAIREEKPLFVGFTTMAWDALGHTIRLSKLIHEMGVKVVWGGPYATMAPETALSEDYVDAVVQGEGEVAAVSLARCLLEDEDLSRVPGIGFKRSDELVIGPVAEPIQDIDQYRPAWELLNIEDYYYVDPLLDNRGTSLPLSRGCPYDCTFCFNGIDKAYKHWRIHSQEWVKEQLDYLGNKLDLNVLALVGDNPFGNPGKAKGIIESIDLKWLASCRPGLLDPDFVSWLEQSRCQGLYFGIESGSDRVLKLMQKGITREEVLAKLENLGRSHALAHCQFMMLFPGETEQDRHQTRYLMDRIHNVNQNSIHSLTVFRPYPLTLAWKYWLEMGGSVPKSKQEWCVLEAPSLAMNGKTRKWLSAQERVVSSLYSRPKMHGPRYPRPVLRLLRWLWLKGRFGPLVSSGLSLASSLRALIPSLKSL